MDARQWVRAIERYRKPNTFRSIFEIVITFVPFVAMWFLTFIALDISYLLTLALAIPTGGLLVRLFIIQHDCGHGSYFSQRWANDWTGRLIGVLTLTPYSYWNRAHAIHHATSGRLERRGHGDVLTLTVKEYQQRSRIGRLRYRLFRNPLVLFVLGPAYMFILHHRVPFGLMDDRRAWISVMGTNLATAIIVGLAIWLIGFKAFFMVHVPIMLLAASAGVWLFYVQHQFENTVWDSGDDWDWHEAAFNGSSFYDLPTVLSWFTGNIGVHHVHHLCSRIPFYRLPQVIKDFPALREHSRLTLLDSLSCVRLVLWDEKRRSLVSFRAAQASA